jgi:hypothetical protein
MEVFVLDDTDHDDATNITEDSRNMKGKIQNSPKISIVNKLQDRKNSAQGNTESKACQRIELRRRRKHSLNQKPVLHHLLGPGSMGEVSQ